MFKFTQFEQSARLMHQAFRSKGFFRLLVAIFYSAEQGGFTCFPLCIAGKLYYQLQATCDHRIRSRRREARKSASECFIVQQQPLSHRIFFHLSASSVPVLFNVFYRQSLLIRRHRSRQSHRPCKDNKRKSYQLIGM